MVARLLGKAADGDPALLEEVLGKDLSGKGWPAVH
jgi:hypothetical protein